MKIIGIAMALIIAIVSPGLASAKDEAISKDQRAKGMAAAPGLLQKAGSDCQVADARYVGEATDAKTKAKTTLYEVACTGAEGLLIQSISTDPTPSVFTCMEAASAAASGNKGATQCILPGNADPKAGIAAYVTKANVGCALDKVRALGHSPTNVFFEIACHDGAGYILQLSAPPRLDKPITAQPCIMFDPTSNIHCELTDRAAQLAVVDRLAAASGKPCAVKDRGFLGVASSGMSYWEVACQDNKGYVLEQKPDGSFSRAIPCVDADAIAGGCKLTDARQAKTDQNALYSQLAKKAGFDCDVSGYAPFEVDVPGKEVVELVCSNRPDGAIALFPVSGGGAGEIYDCAHSELKSFRCTLTKASAAYSKLTADLKTLGKTSCVVSDSRVVGVSADQHGYIEVGCADGLPGYMIEYNLSPISPKSPLVCAEAKGISGGCTLPGNKKG
jgi:hypothetical protein